MNYSKPPLSISAQIAKLKARGLRIPDEAKATHYLSNISFYRLRAYTYPFQDNNDPAHPFTTNISFDDIVSLYIFDRKLRLLVFDALEKIEVAMRTKITYYMAMRHGPYWHEQGALYRSNTLYIKHLDDLYKEIDRSKEIFIDHYKSTYTNPQYPPCWMSLEVASMGLLSKLYTNLQMTPEKKAIAKAFGLPHVTYLENWMLAFTNVRNICAHHSRLWNRRLITLPDLPQRPSHPFLNDISAVYPNKLFAVLSCMSYLLKRITPEYNFAGQIKHLIGQFTIVNLHDMGFPEGWEDEPVWST